MLELAPLLSSDRPLRLLCLGAHADDIEIGCGGTVLRILEERPETVVRWVVFSGDETRAAEAEDSAGRFLQKASERDVTIHAFRDGFFPFQGVQIKEVFEELKSERTPHVILTHHGADRHQDHRLISELTWNTFRDHLILEYEIPKYDGGLTTPNLYVPLAEEIRERKLDYLMNEFPSQRNKMWYSRATFLALMRLRGVEAGTPQGYAEGLHMKKATFGFLGTA